MYRYFAFGMMFFSPFLTAGSCKKTDNVTTDVVIPDPQKTIQVLGIEPELVQIGSSEEGNISGEGFQLGAEVYIANELVSAVEFLSENNISLTIPPLDAGEHDVKVINPDGSSHTLYGGLKAEIPVLNDAFTHCDEHVILFDVDKATLRKEAIDSLQEFADCFKQIEYRYVVEGHCDERGTTQHNLAFGLSRATTVQKYLQSVGISESRIEVKSYGEESPVDSSSSEDAWRQNRRAVIKFIK